MAVAELEECFILLELQIYRRKDAARENGQFPGKHVKVYGNLIASDHDKFSNPKAQIRVKLILYHIL